MLVCVLFNGLSGNEVTASCEEVMHNSWINDEDSSGEEEADQHWESARFLLCATELHSLTHGMDDLPESIQSFVETVSSQIAK